MKATAVVIGPDQRRTLESRQFFLVRNILISVVQLTSINPISFFYISVLDVKGQHKLHTTFCSIFRCAFALFLSNKTCVTKEGLGLTEVTPWVFSATD